MEIDAVAHSTAQHSETFSKNLKQIISKMHNCQKKSSNDCCTENVVLAVKIGDWK